MRDDDLEIAWTIPARESIEVIHRYISCENPKAADRVIHDIRSRMTQLAGQPGLVFVLGLGRVWATFGKSSFVHIVSSTSTNSCDNN